jgi:ABC-type Fe3+ transport system substrate-binding protein
MERVKSIAVNKRILHCILGGTFALLLAGCGGQNASTPTATNNGGQAGDTGSTQLVIVSPHTDSVRTEFERAFKEKHPDATFQWLNPGGSSDLLRFVLDQFKAKQNKDDGIGADLFFGGGPETFVEIEAADLLQPLPSDYKIPAELNGVPLRAKNNLWVGAALSGFGIMYNKPIAARDKLPVPVVWADLGKPALQNRIELADPRKSGSAHASYEIILQTNGWENGWKILAAMAGNSRSFVESASQLVNDVSNGEAVFVPAIDFYARAKMATAGREKIGYIEPQGQSVVTPDPIGILRGAKNKKLAEEFVAFVLSPEGQKIWMLDKGAPGGPKTEAIYRMAILPSLYKPLSKASLVTRDPYSVKNARPYDSKKAGARRRVLDDMIGAILIDNHGALKARQKSKGDASTLMLAPSEDEINKVIPQWGDAAFTQQKLGEWRDAARKKIG